MPRPLHTPCRVLVVDDDPGICALLQVTISLDTRFELVATAGNGLEARRHAGADPGGIDAVLLDVTLPDCDGIVLLEELQGTLGDDTRFALYTGWSDDETMLVRAREAGADAVFRKDLSPPRLLDQLADLCALAPDRVA